MSAQELKKHDGLQLIVKQENILIEEKLWAKLNPKKSLIDHMLETGIVAGCLMNGIFRPLVNKLVEKFSRRILATSVVQLGGFLYVKISPAISYFSFSKNALLRKNPAY